MAGSQYTKENCEDLDHSKWSVGGLSDQSTADQSTGSVGRLDPTKVAELLEILQVTVVVGYIYDIILLKSIEHGEGTR